LPGPFAEGPAVFPPALKIQGAAPKATELPVGTGPEVGKTFTFFSLADS